MRRSTSSGVGWVMGNSTLSSPVYEIPMDDSTLIVLGRIAVMWGQIEAHLEFILINLSGLPPEEYMAGNKHIGISGKLSQLSRLLSDPKFASIRTHLLLAHQEVDDCISDRNVTMHGLWGWGELESGNWVACSRSPRREEPILVTELINLHERVRTAALAMDIALSHVVKGGHKSGGSNKRQIWPSDPKRGIPPLPAKFER